MPVCGQTHTHVLHKDKQRENVEGKKASKPEKHGRKKKVKITESSKDSHDDNKVDTKINHQPQTSENTECHRKNVKYLLHSRIFVT